MRLLFAAMAAWLLAAAGALAKDAAHVGITMDTKLAERLLAVACSGEDVDEDEFRASDILKAQIAHHSGFGKQFTMDNFIAGLKEASRCKAPNPDPFRFAAIVERRAEMEHALGVLTDRQEEIAAEVSRMLTPYVPAGVDFSGGVVIAAASFSCGGFARDAYFFIDLQCIAAEIEEEIDAVKYLSAHETYHAIQSRFVPPPVQPDIEKIANADEALGYIFHELVTEGTASYVADFRKAEGNGSYAKFSRNAALSNYRRLRLNFLLFDYLTESLSIGTGSPSQRAKDVEELGFGGRFDELFYYVGEQMAAEVDADFGPSALVCVLQLPAGNFLLAYERAYEKGERLPDSYPLRPATYDAARALAAKQGGTASLDACLKRRAH